jgi:phosphatidylserine/phosphatidylglycerophosphate/cardiolipin synthase-like enzyme
VRPGRRHRTGKRIGECCYAGRSGRSAIFSSAGGEFPKRILRRKGTKFRREYIQRKIGDSTPTEVILADFARRFREREWPRSRLPEVFYDPRSLTLDTDKRSSLHAKCVVIDRRVALVSSANFTEAAQVRNIEAGVLIHSATFAATLAEHFEVLAAQGLLSPLTL